jgi:hypothetical protein
MISGMDSTQRTLESDTAWRERAEALLEPEQVHWLALSMDERLAALDDIFKDYQRLGGSLEPDADPQSPFWSREELQSFARSQGTLVQSNK